MPSAAVSAVLLAATLVLGAGPAQARPSPDDGASVSGPAVFAGTPILDVGAAGETRLAVPLDRRVDVAVRAEPGKLIFRLAGARRAGNRSPSVSPREDGPVKRVELVSVGDDLDVVIELRYTVAATHGVARTGEGFELRITLPRKPAGSTPDTGPDTGPAPPATHDSPPLPPTPSPSADTPAPAHSPSPTASSETTDTTPPVRAAAIGRSLGGHSFLTPARFASAFAVTEVGLSIAFSHATYTGYTDRDNMPYEAHAAGLAERLDLGVRVLPRVAVIGALGGSIALGADGQSLLGIGAEGGFDWMVGVTGVVARFEQTGTQVGARLSVEGQVGGRLVSIERLVNDSIDSKSVPASGELFGARSKVLGRFSWSVAQAIGRHFSAQTSLGFAGGWRDVGGGKSTDALHLDFGLALAADAAPFVPVALLLEYDGDTYLHRSGPRLVGPAELLSTDDASAYLAGLYYSGRPDLLLGALGGAAVPVGLPGRTVAQGRFELRYFF